MLDKLASIEARYVELENLLADPEIVSDYAQVAKYSKERSDIASIVEHYRDYQRQAQELDDARTMLRDEEDPELRELAEMEAAELEASTAELLEKLKIMLLPKDLRDDKNVIVEVRAGAGGDEAGIFAGDLFRMYTRYAKIDGGKPKL